MHERKREQKKYEKPSPEILKSREHPYFVFMMFCPQIVSTKDLPHPIFTQFIKQAQKNKELNFSTQGGIKR